MNRPFQRATELAQKFRAQLPKRPLWAKASPERGALYVYEVIGEDWWTGGGVTAKAVAAALQDAKADGIRALDIYINSEGGDVFEAKAIFESLKRFEGEKVVHVDGLAASAATFVAMAGDRIITAPAATWMVHEAWTMACGRASDLRAMADVLELQNKSIAETYARRTGRPVDEMLAIMAAETWMDAAAALKAGFTDEVREDPEEEPAQAKASPLVAAAASTESRLSLAGQMLVRAQAKNVMHSALGRTGQHAGSR